MAAHRGLPALRLPDRLLGRGARRAAGDRSIDFLSKWEPNAYCHYHRHLGPTTLLVLEGEHHVIEKTATETVHKIRKPGFFARNPGGDVHMEFGGPQGAVVFFSVQAVEGGKLFDVMDADGKVLVTATIDDFLNGKLKG